MSTERDQPLSNVVFFPTSKIRRKIEKQKEHNLKNITTLKPLELPHYHRTCRVAYTLGNKQPVLCTYIGDQPLFYLEYEEDAKELQEYIDEDLKEWLDNEQPET